MDPNSPAAQQVRNDILGRIKGRVIAGTGKAGKKARFTGYSNKKKKK